MTQDIKTGIAVIGAGRQGRQHMTNAQATPGFEIRVVADTVAETAKEQAACFGAAAWTTDPGEAIRRDDVDLVFVCTPAGFHADAVVEAATNGKHIFCEKPLALSLDDGKRIIRATESAGVTLALNFQRRFEPCFLTLRKWIQSGRMGTPAYYSIVEALPVRPLPAMHDRCLNGGPLLDMFCHWLDTWRFVFNSEPVRVHACTATFARGKSEVATVAELAVDTATVTVEFASGHVGAYLPCWGLPRGTPMAMRHTVVGPQAFVEVTPFSKLILHEGEQKEVLEDLTVKAANKQMQHLAACLRNGASPSTSGQDGMVALKVSLAALASAESGQTVEIGLPLNAPAKRKP